jgi:hypothetical protein
MIIYHERIKMKKNVVILEIFDFLKQRGLVSNESDFSIDWLGQSDSYFRGLRFKRTEPTLGVVAICGTRLSSAGEFIRQSPKHHHVAEKFFEFRDRCTQIVNEDAIELELIS